MLKVLAASFILFYGAAFYAEATPLLDGRIIGGEEASILDYPYQVSVEYLGILRCGGAIIGRTWILSASHCAERLLFPGLLKIRVGTSYQGTGGRLHDIKWIIHHSNFSTANFDYDIALFQLVEPIDLSASARIIGLPDNDAPIPEGSIARVAGWGLTSQGGNASTVLRAVELPVVSQSVCRDLISPYDITDRMLCAGFWDGGKDSCSGDGGGPLVSNSRVIGLVSWGVGCARPQSPAVYTNVAALRDWITGYTGI